MPIPLKLALFPVLVGQAVLARRRAPVLPEAAGPRHGRVVPPSLVVPAVAGSAVAAPLRLLIVGDSSAAGVGVEHQDRALSGHLTRTVAERSGRVVDWELKARSGATTPQALRLLQRDPPAPADVAVAVLGVNDVIDQIGVRRSVLNRARLADWLMERAGVQHVVFAPLPPVHQLPLLPGLLARVAGDDARRHDEALARWAATRSDVWHVPIDLTLDASVLAIDRFHPGEPVYRACGEALGAFVAERLFQAGAEASSAATGGQSAMTVGRALAVAEDETAAADRGARNGRDPSAVHAAFGAGSATGVGASGRSAGSPQLGQ